MSDPLWIPASEALVILQPFFGGSRATKEMLADLLRDSKLKAFAEQMWKANHPEARFKVPHSDLFEMHSEVQIPHQFWRKSRNWTEDQERWRWPEGNFIISVGTAQTEHVFLKHVHFDRNQVFATHRRARELEETRKKRGGGRVTPAHKWAIITEAVLRLDRSKKLTASRFETGESLANELVSDPELENIFKRTVLEEFCRHIVGHCLR